MLPSLKIIRSGLQRATEALAADLGSARGSGTTPDWTALEWQLAAAAAAAHGVSPLLATTSAWQNVGWKAFLAEQREHVYQRYIRIAVLLDAIDQSACAAGLAIMPLKGSALHALKVYLPGDRPMADVDLLTDAAEVERAGALLRELGYEETLAVWKHRVFKAVSRNEIPGLGEHRDRPITIELHTRIHERLPVSAVDITARIYPPRRHPGLNPYASTGALMSHLLLHTAGNIRTRTLRLLHLIDIARLAPRMREADWDVLWGSNALERPWWALPPLRMTARYFPGAVPATVLARLEAECPPLLRMTSRRQTLSDTSCSDLWIQALPGVEWSRSVREAALFIKNRLMPDKEATSERLSMAESQEWLQGQSWARLSRGRQILARLTRPVPRPDTLYVVRAALARPAANGQ